MKKLMMCVFALSFIGACGGSKSTEEKDVKETAVEKAEPIEGAETSAENVLANDGTRQVGDVTECLVTGHTFTVSDKSPAVEHEGKTYYMCCDGCTDKFKADPAKFIAGHREPKAMDGDPSAALPNDGTRKVGDVTTCPVSGNVFTISDKSPVAEHDGGKYYMCCGGCTDKFKADPAKFLAATGEKKEMHDHSGHKH